MAPKQNPRIGKAFRAMKELGISEDTVKPALKNLLKVYEKNWEYIEDENYRVLVDAIFEIEEEKVLDQPENPLKRHRTSHGSQYFPSNASGNATSSGTSLEGANANDDTELADVYLQPLQTVMETPDFAVTHIDPMDESEPESPPTSLVLRDRRLTSSTALAIVEASNTNEALHFSQRDLQDQHNPSGKEKTYSERSPQILITKNFEINPQTIPDMMTNTCTFIEPKTEPTATEIPSEELAITNFQPETTIEMIGTDPISIVEDVGTRTASQSVSNEDVEASNRICIPEETAVYRVIQAEDETPTLFCNFEKGIADAPLLLSEDVGLSSETNRSRTSIHNVSGGNIDNIIDNVEGRKMLEVGSGKSVSVNTEERNQNGIYETTYLLDTSDITRGEENIKISIVNHFSNVPLPSFCYIHQSLIGQNASVNASLAQIGKEDFCPNCVGDCLSLKESRVCACTIGERCVYALNGFLNEGFLEESISITRNPEKHEHFFCDRCPLEVGPDNDALKPCQGHTVRKFIKECWHKCHCSQDCTNRRVQRGISCKLQVFMTSGGKGWGLRTIEDLPKGAFVCEYVGEILTLSEFYLRTQSCIRNCTYAMVLDARWASSINLKEDKDKILCLDASVYGNVARFINHRCTDANLVAIPVTVESSDPLYHRVAFFTSRKVVALEELTRDYGINFEVFDSVTKPFRCRCGSRFCRNIKHYNRKRGKDFTPRLLL